MRRGALVLLLVLAGVGPATAPAKPLHGQATLTCEGRVSFSETAFRNPTGAEQGDDEAAQALRDYLASPAGNGLPAIGWRVLTRSDMVIVFHAGVPTSGSALTFVRDDGTWTFGNRGCSRRRVVQRYSVAPLRLHGRPSADSRTITLAMRGGGCDGHPGNRFRTLMFIETRAAVTALALLRPAAPVPPDVVCPAVEYIYLRKIHLSAPLGRRAILDASIFPSRRIGHGR